MNLLDFAILGVFALFALIGWYNGFFVSLLNLAGFFLSWLCGMVFSPLVANGILGQEKLTSALLYYTEGAELVADVEMRRLAVGQLSADGLNQVLSDAALPRPLDTLIAKNMAGEVFASEGVTTVGEYFNQTIVAFTINVASFLIVFLITWILFGLIIHGVDHTVRLPVLKHFDGPLGAGFGAVRGFFVLFVLFMVVPTVLVVLPFPEVREFLEQSFFGPFFYGSNFLLSFMKGVV